MHELFLYLQSWLTAQNWGVVYQFCEHSFFHLHFILPQGGMCWQEISLNIYIYKEISLNNIYIYVICIPLEPDTWFKGSAKFGILCFRFVLPQDCL